jgi:hypothetical protein
MPLLGDWGLMCRWNHPIDAVAEFRAALRTDQGTARWNLP